jgi:hypothetical protein
VLWGMRPYDCGLHEHLWSFTLGSRQFVCETLYDDDDELPLAASTRLSSLGLHEASRLLFEYDLGDTTIVTLKLEQTGDATAPP